MIETEAIPVHLKAFQQQGLFINDPTAFVAAIAGTGGGKTRAGAMKAMAFIGENYGCHGCVTAPTYKMMTMPDATLDTYLKIIPERLIKSFNKAELELSLKTGSKIVFRSTEDPETLRGPNLSWFHMDEAALSPLSAWYNLISRLRQGDTQQGWLTTTPKGYNWIYQEFVAQVRKDYSVHRWSARDNLYNPPEFIKRLEDSFHDEFALQEIEGEFVEVSGQCMFQLEGIKGMLADCRSPVEERGNGLIKIFKKPVVARRYAAGVDLGEGNGGDYSVAIILDTTTLEAVCTLRSNTLHQDLFAFEWSKLYEEYYSPYYVPESNVGGLFIKKAIELGCTNLFYEDGDKRNKPGFRTTSNSKPMVWGLLEEAVRNREIIIPDRDIVSEMFSFIRNGDKLEAQEGAHDDCVDALALALKAARERGTGKGSAPVSPWRQSDRMY